MEQLINCIKSHVNISNPELEIILAHFTEEKLSKGQFVLKKGHIAAHYYFVKSGGLRFFFTTKKTEVTAWVALEGEFFTEITSVKFQTPSRFNIHAIEDTVLHTISIADMEKLYNLFPLWQAFGRKVYESMLANIIVQIINLQTLTAEERYLAAISESTLLQRIPLKQLCSLIGITPNSLSRIRKTLSRDPR